MLQSGARKLANLSNSSADAMQPTCMCSILGTPSQLAWQSGWVEAVKLEKIVDKTSVEFTDRLIITQPNTTNLTYPT